MEHFNVTINKENCKQTTAVAVSDWNLLATILEGMSDCTAELRVRYLHHVNT